MVIDHFNRLILWALLCSALNNLVSADVVQNRHVKFNSRALSALAPDTVRHGKATYMGSCNEKVCSWKGLRYAAPPVNALRFAAARDPETPSGTIDATQFGSQCLQGSTHANQSDDCLFANIYRPANISANHKLPVLIYVHGGGFQAGAGQNLDPSDMIAAGTMAKLPAIVITINYRLGLFGFLGGSTFFEQQKRHHTVTLNAALTDVRQAIRWTRYHIGAFGGDVNRITLWGQSAGSFLSAGQLLGSTTKKQLGLHGVILESGSPGGVPIDPPSAKDAQYNSVVEQAGCSGSADTIACLRGVSAETLANVSNTIANLNNNFDSIPRGFYSWTMMQDGGPDNKGFYYDRPSVVLKAGNFAKTNVMHGDCLDEGTYFAYHSNDTQTTQSFFEKIYLNTASDNLVNQILTAYPDDPPQGSPFLPRSGDYNDRYFGPTSQFKRVAALYGDLRYPANKRLFFSQAARYGVEAYSYEFEQYTSTIADAFGVPHASDQPYILVQQKDNPYGDLLARQWLSFTTYGTPNKHGVEGVPHWSAYTKHNKRSFRYANATLSMIDDTYRQEQIALLNSDEVLKVSGR